ncbi:hypothetical protein ACX1C1_09370 [Paenibacillus sp. strain BS8-2]
MYIGKVILIILVTLSVSGCGGWHEKQDNQLQSATNNVTNRELLFKRVVTNEIPESTPPVDWSNVKTIGLGLVDDKPISVHFYSKDILDNSNNIQNNNIEVQALFQYEGKLYDYEQIIPCQLSEVEARKVDGSFNDIVVLAGIGTAFTYWNIIALDKISNKLLSFQTIGQPEMIDLDSDGHEELVAAFEGAHINFPNMKSFDSRMDRWKPLK